jgi:hypothetical protein
VLDLLAQFLERLYEKSGKVANRCSTRRRKRLKGASLDVSGYRRPPIAEPPTPFSYSL